MRRNFETGMRAGGYAILFGIAFSLLFPAVPGASAEQTSTVFIEDQKECKNESCFSEEGLIIRQGTTVTWKNSDATFHTILSGTADYGRDGNFESGMMLPGEEFSVAFTNEGYYSYYCEAHPWMTGMVLVV